jgi:hypothetical protein
MIPAHLAAYPWYAHHQAWLRDQGLPHHQPSAATVPARAYLHGAHLRFARLTCAYLTGVYLGGANMRGAYLGVTDLTGAYLTDTILDPAAPCPAITDEQIAAAGLTLRVVRGRERLYGRRSARPLYYGTTDYTRQGWHRAPWFSVDPGSPCHPGIYLGGTHPAERGVTEWVSVWCYRDEAVYCGAEYGCRARRVYSLGGVE